MHISAKKWNRLRKRVIPYVVSAARLYEKDLLKKSEDEMATAYRNLRKENVFPPEIMHDFAALYNNLGTRWITVKKDYVKGFELFRRSLSLKLKYEPAQISSIRGTFENMLTPAVMCCQFDYLKTTMALLMKKYSQERSFVDYLQGCLEVAKKVEGNEPFILVAGMSTSSAILTRPLGEWIYFPKSFEEPELSFEMQLNLSDHATLDCVFTMATTKPEREFPEPYQEDSWKRMVPPGLEPKIQGSTPNLIIFLTEAEHIPLNTVEIESRAGPERYDFRIVRLAEFLMPESYHRFGFAYGTPPEIPLCKSYKYFRGKAGVLEWKFKHGEIYRIQLSIKNHEEPSSTSTPFNIRFGVLTPFNRVRLNESYLRQTQNVTAESIKQNYIEYFDEREGHGQMSLTPEPDSISEEHFSDGSVPEYLDERRLYRLGPEILEDCAIIGLSIRYTVSDETLSIATHEWEQPIPLALSHLLIGKRFGFPPLCRYNIVNNSKNEVNAALSTEIEGFSSAQEEIKQVLPYSIEHVDHTPVFKEKKLAETCVAGLKTTATIEGKKIFQKTVEKRLLASDTMIWGIRNPLTRDYLRLHDFVVNWVTPHDESLEDLISIAKDFHPMKVLQGYPSNLSNDEIREIVDSQCKAIFEALRSIGLSYVDSHVSFGWLEPYESQRIRFPSASIRMKAANCIDGSVLFASLLENIGIHPIIVILPTIGHALVGWRPSPLSREIVLLETTQIVSGDFENAKRSGQKSIRRGLANARRVSNEPGLTLEGAVRRGLIRVVDVRKMREVGIFPA